MSAGKSDVVAYGIEDHDTAQLWAVEIELRGAKMRSVEYGDKIVPLVPASLLLDARAELAAKDEAYRLQFEACASMNGKLERAEAQAVESSRQLDLYRKAVNEIDDRVEYSTFNRDTIYAILSKLTDGLAAIDAVGGRGE